MTETTEMGYSRGLFVGHYRELAVLGTLLHYEEKDLEGKTALERENLGGHNCHHCSTMIEHMLAMQRIPRLVSR